MQINNLTPTPFGHGSRPDHAGGANRQSEKFQPAAAGADPADPADAASTPAAAEPTAAADIPGKSVAHRARQHLAELAGLGGHNFGWLVSQIARGSFDIAAYTTDSGGDGGDGVTEAGAAAPADEPGETTAETTTEEPAEAPVANLLDSLEQGDAQTPPATKVIVDPVADLVDELLPDGDNEPEIT